MPMLGTIKAPFSSIEANLLMGSEAWDLLDFFCCHLSDDIQLFWCREDACHVDVVGADCAWFDFEACQTLGILRGRVRLRFCQLWTYECSPLWIDDSRFNPLPTSGGWTHPLTLYIRGGGSWQSNKALCNVKSLGSWHSRLATLKGNWQPHKPSSPQPTNARYQCVLFCSCWAYK